MTATSAPYDQRNPSSSEDNSDATPTKGGCELCRFQIPSIKFFLADPSLFRLHLRTCFPAVTVEEDAEETVREAIIAAVGLAQQAVKLDAAGDYDGAVAMYHHCILCLTKILSNGRYLGIQDNEIPRLKAIVETYTDRMVRLCEEYHIPTPGLGSSDSLNTQLLQ
jgi:hypothetical protein